MQAGFVLLRLLLVIIFSFVIRIFNKGISIIVSCSIVIFVTVIFIIFISSIFTRSCHTGVCEESTPFIRGNRLSNTTCLTHVFFKLGANDLTNHGGS